MTSLGSVNDTSLYHSCCASVIATDGMYAENAGAVFCRDDSSGRIMVPRGGQICQEQIYESLPCDSPVNRPAKLFKIIPDDFVT
jgi:hypothetical protein